MGVYVCVCVFMNMCVYVCVWMCMCAYGCACVHIHICIGTHSNGWQKSILVPFLIALHLKF